MKIAIVITRSDAIGGASIHVLGLALGMLRRGHDVHVFLGGDGPFKTLLEKNKIPVTSISYMVRELNPLKDTLAIFQLIKEVKKYNPDLIHAHSSKAGILARISARVIKKPVVFTAHGWAFTEGKNSFVRRVYLFIERKVAFLSSHIITVSNYDRDLALRSGVGSDDLITTVHNGVPENKLYRNDNSLGKDADVKIIMVARFDAPKDQLKLIKALMPLRDLRWTLELLGSGPNLAKIEEFVIKEGLNDRVCMPGESDKVEEKLAASDVFVLISSWEGLPLSILEAMAAGLPIIASNVGGIPELVSNGRNGFLVDYESGEQDLTSKLKILITDASLRSELGYQSHLIYKNAFDINEMIVKTEEVYHKAISN